MSPQHGRVAVVTGAARGIGAATVRRLAADGATVVALDRDGSAAHVVTGLPVPGLAVRCDVTDAEAVRSAVARIVGEFGRIDILVNNAAILRNAELLTMDRAEWDDVLATNLTGPFTLTRCVAPVMTGAGYGRIVFVSSLAAASGNRGQANYAAAKAGLGGLARTAALELGRCGVTCNVVAPGYVATEMFAEAVRAKGLDPDEHADTLAAGVAVGRIGRPEDIAAVIAFFAAPDSGFVTGQTLYATGSPM